MPPPCTRTRLALQAAKAAAIRSHISGLEPLSPVPAPIDNLELCAGQWELLYSTITITVRPLALPQCRHSQNLPLPSAAASTAL